MRCMQKPVVVVTMSTAKPTMYAQGIDEAGGDGKVHAKAGDGGDRRYRCGAGGKGSDVEESKWSVATNHDAPLFLKNPPPKIRQKKMTIQKARRISRKEQARLADQVQKLYGCRLSSTVNQKSCHHLIPQAQMGIHYCKKSIGSDRQGQYFSLPQARGAVCFLRFDQQMA